MTTDELIQYYADLLIAQYALKTKARGTVSAFVRQAVADQIIAQVRDAFNLSATSGLQPGTAQGAQLDDVASYVGARRLIFGFNPSRSYFTMPFYGAADADTAPGFALYGQSPILDLWLTYVAANQPIYALTDDELCRLTQFVAQENSMLMSIENIDDLLFSFFGDNAGVREGGDMGITYIDLISDTDTLFTILNATGSLPRPAGVKVTVMRSETLSDFFGFQLYGQALNPDFVGFGLYGSPQAGSFVRYG